MHKDGGSWHYNFLYLDVEAPVPQQVRTPLPSCCLCGQPQRKAVPGATSPDGAVSFFACCFTYWRPLSLISCRSIPYHAPQVVLVRPGQSETDY